MHDGSSRGWRIGEKKGSLDVNGNEGWNGTLDMIEGTRGTGLRT